MAHDDDNDAEGADSHRLDEADLSRQVAAVTGMSGEAAATYAAFLSGRFAPRSSFRDAA
jgi:hypothetical protein